MTNEQIKQLIADAAYSVEGKWQPEETQRKNAAHIADAVFVKLDAAGALKMNKPTKTADKV